MVAITDKNTDEVFQSSCTGNFNGQQNVRYCEFLKSENYILVSFGHAYLSK